MTAPHPAPSRVQRAAESAYRDTIIEELADTQRALNEAGHEIMALRHALGLDARRVSVACLPTPTPTDDFRAGMEEAARVALRQRSDKAGMPDSRWQDGYLCGCRDAAAAIRARATAAGPVISQDAARAMLAALREIDAVYARALEGFSEGWVERNGPSRVLSAVNNANFTVRLFEDARAAIRAAGG